MISGSKNYRFCFKASGFTLPKIVSLKDELKKLYKSRWNVELDIRHIKDTMGTDVLSCKTPEMANKEMWVYFFAYNLIRFLMINGTYLTWV
jgi:hypothetical protein|tara:strand:+ start:313 stop:585 length:273 start_codon:yes stop_codon:yes gene_type:complete